MHLLHTAHVRCRWGFASAFYILFRNDQVTCRNIAVASHSSVMCQCHQQA
jgi:hypothetical protein